MEIYTNEAAARVAKPRAFESICARPGYGGGVGYVHQREPRADGTTLVTRGWWVSGEGRAQVSWVEPWSFDEARRALVARTGAAIAAYEQIRARLLEVEGRGTDAAAYRAARDAADSADLLRRRARLTWDGQPHGWPLRLREAEMRALALALSETPTAAEIRAAVEMAVSLESYAPGERARLGLTKETETAIAAERARLGLDGCRVAAAE